MMRRLNVVTWRRVRTTRSLYMSLKAAWAALERVRICRERRPRWVTETGRQGVAGGALGWQDVGGGPAGGVRPSRKGKVQPKG